MELTKYFEYNIFPQVIEYVKQHPTIDAKTALLIFTTDTVRNAVNYESIVNNMPKEKPLADLYPTFTQQINDVYHQYKGYLEQLEAFEDAITQIPDLSLDYIRGDYSVNAIGSVREMLEVCDNNIFPAIEAVVNKYDVPETQQITDIIDKLRHYNEHYFEAWEIRDIDQLVNRLYTTSFALVNSVLDNIGFEGIGILYKEILENTGKERAKYNVESPILMMSKAVNAIFTDLTNPDPERVKLIEDKFVEWFTGTMQPKELSDVYQDLLHHPTIMGIATYVTLFQSMGDITRIGSKNKNRFEHVVQGVCNLALLVDKSNYPQIVEQLDNVLQQYNSRKPELAAKQLAGIYNDIISKLQPDDMQAITTLVLTFYRNAITNSRYIPMAYDSANADDVHYVAVIDKQNVLQTAASYDIQGTKISPFMSSIKTTNAKTKIDKYLTSFLGNNNPQDNRISAYQSSVVADLKSRYQDKWEPLFMAVKNKILARIPEGITTTDNMQDNTAELALFKAIAEVWADPTTTSNEREILERLLPPHAYMDFVNSVAQQGKNDIVRSSLKQLTPEELCVMYPEKWSTPSEITNTDIDNCMHKLEDYICRNAATMSFESYVLTGGMDDQYILLGLIKPYVQCLNKMLEGHGKLTVLSTPTAKDNTKGLDIAIASTVHNNDGTMTINVSFFDSKSTSNANTKNGSALSNITQCACIKYRIKESEIKQINNILRDIRDNLDELLPKIINSKQTPILGQMPYDNIYTLIKAVLSYSEDLPDNVKHHLHVNTSAPDNPQSVRAAFKFKDNDSLDYLATIIGKDEVKEKFVIGELFKEITYVMHALTKDVDGVVDLAITDPQYISPIFYTDSLIPSTIKQYKQLESALISQEQER